MSDRAGRWFVLGVDGWRHHRCVCFTIGDSGGWSMSDQQEPTCGHRWVFARNGIEDAGVWVCQKCGLVRESNEQEPTPTRPVAKQGQPYIGAEVDAYMDHLENELAAIKELRHSRWRARARRGYGEGGICGEGRCGNVGWGGV